MSGNVWGFGFNSLTQASSVSTGDMFVIWKTQNSEWETAPFNIVLDAIQSNLTFPNAYTTQYASPSATGFTVTISAGSDGQSDIHLILTPVAGYASGTIVLPLASTCRDGQRLQVNCTQSVTTLALTLNGAAGAVDAPTTLAANAFFTLAYDLPSTNWYRVG